MIKLRILDLFSGIGGFSLGLERTGGFETAAFCEIEEYPRKILAKHWPHVPIYKDVRTLDATQLGRIDVICGGYPCQPFSHSGKRLGTQDDRHLWPEMRRLVEQIKPDWVIGENVAGHISMGLDNVLSDLEGLDYTTQAFVIPACALNAPHRRDRVWILAHSNSPQRERRGISSRIYKEHSNPSSESRWEAEPSVGRVADGIPNRVDRLRALGNAVVPQIPEMIGYAILSSLKENQP